MSTSIGPKISDTSLVFSYDIRNINSWRGKPTTNYYSNPDTTWNGTTFNIGYNYDSTTAPTHSFNWIPGVPNPAGANAVLRYYSGANSGYKFFSLDTNTVPTTQNYTYSFYARIFAGPTSTSNLNNTQLWRNNGAGDQAVTGDWNPTFTSEWVKYVAYGSVASSNILQYLPIHGGAILPGYTIDYCGFQLEPGIVASPWNYGSARTTTNCLLDQTKRSTLTLQTDVAYDSDGTPKFAGTVNSFIQTNATVVPAGLVPYTVSCWVKRPGNSGTQTFLSAWTSATTSNAFYLSFNAGETMRFSDNWTGVPVPGSAVVNTWINIVAVNEGNNAKIYVNGELKATKGNTLAYTGTGPLVIGRQGEYNIGEFFTGEVDEVQVYTRAFNENDVQKHYNANRGVYGV
jgi:hypothetical protein